MDDLLDYVDKQVGDQEIESGLAAIELGIFDLKKWTEKQKTEIHKRVELHKTARKEVDRLGRTHFRSIKGGRFVSSR